MCPNLRCRKILAVPSHARGSRVRCTYCGTLLAVPQAKALFFQKTGAPAKKDKKKESK